MPKLRDTLSSMTRVGYKTMQCQVVMMAMSTAMNEVRIDIDMYLNLVSDWAYVMGQSQ